MNIVQTLFKRARESFLRRSSTDAADPMEEPESSINALLGQYADDIRAAEAHSRMPWIVRPLPQHDLVRRAILLLAERQREIGATLANEDLIERARWECVCRCVEHKRIACPKCLNVYGCPVHSEVEVGQLQPEALEDAVRLARDFHATYAQLAGAEAPIAHERWELNPPAYRDAMIETMRRIVCARFQAHKQG